MSAQIDFQADDPYYTTPVEQQDNSWYNINDYDAAIGDAMATAAETSALSQDSALGQTTIDFEVTSARPTDMAAYAGVMGGSAASGRTVEQNNPASPDGWIAKLKSIWSDASQFGRDNKDNPLMQMALSGVNAAFKAKSAQESAMALLDKKAQIDKDKIAANSASVAGLPRAKGMISRPLTRIGGAPVFNSKGMIQ